MLKTYNITVDGVSVAPIRSGDIGCNGDAGGSSIGVSGTTSTITSCKEIMEKWKRSELNLTNQLRINRFVLIKNKMEKKHIGKIKYFSLNINIPLKNCLKSLNFQHNVPNSF